MSTPQRLPIVDSDDGVWGDILRQYLMKEHTNDDTDNAVNGGHKTITVTAGTTSAGTAPIKLTSGPLMTVSEAGAIEFLSDNLYFTQTTGSTRKKIALYDDSSGATGDIYYRNSSGYFTRLAAGSNGNTLTLASGVPSWSSSTTGQTINLASNTLTGTTAQFNTALSDNDFATLAGVETLTNKTLTTPKINAIRDANNATVLGLNYTSNAVNYVSVNNSATGIWVGLSAQGTDSDIALYLYPKGGGDVVVYGDSGQIPTIRASGNDANHDLKLLAKGTGRVTINDIPIVTTTDTQTITNKTLADPILTGQTVAGDYARTSATLHLKGGSGGTPILQMSRGSGETPSSTFDFALAGGGFSIRDVDNGYSVGANIFANTSSAQIYLGQKASTTDNSAKTATLSAGTHQASAGTDVNGPKLIVQGGLGTGAGTPGAIEFKTGVAVGSGTTAQSSAVRASISTSGEFTLASAGSSAGSVVTVDGTQTLTNKSLTDPKINTIKSVAGHTAVIFGDYGSGDQHVFINGGATVGVIGAWGSNADIDLQIRPRGSGDVAIYGATGQIPTLKAAGADVNHDLNLASKGSGTVKVNGIEVTTISDTQTLTNKTISGASNTITNIPTSAIPDAARLVRTIGGGTPSGEWAKVCTFAAPSSPYVRVALILSVTSFAYNGGIISVEMGNLAVSSASARVEYISKGTSNVLRDDGFKIVSDGYGNDFELWVKSGGNGSVFQFYEIARYGGAGYLTYPTDSTWQASEPTGASLNVTSTGVVAGGVPVVTTTGTQTLTNKTISGSSNTLSNIAQSSVTDLVSDLSGKVDKLTAGANHKLYGVNTSGVQTSFDMVGSNITSGSIPFRDAGGQFFVGTPTNAAHPVTKAYSDSGTQTLTNKTLTTPIINDSATISGSGVPTITLDTSNSAQRDDILLSESSAVKAYLQWRGTTNATLPNSVRFQTNTGTNADILIGTNAGTAIFVAGGQNGLTNNRVGIANLTPAVALDVTGEIRASSVSTNANSVVTNTGTQTLTNKTISGSSNTLSNIAQSSITNLDTDLGAKLPTVAFDGQVFGGINLASDPDCSRSALWTAGVACTPSISTEQAHSGTQSLKLVFTGTSSYPTICFIRTSTGADAGDNSLAVRAGDKFYMSAWIRAKAGNADPTITAYIQAWSTDSTGGVGYSFTNSAQVVPNSSGWTQITHTFTVPAGRDRLNVRMGFVDPAPYNAGDTFYVDDLVLEDRTGTTNINQALYGANDPASTILDSALPSSAVTLTGTQTLTNKTLTSPTLSTASTALTVGTAGGGTTTPSKIVFENAYGTNAQGSNANQKIQLYSGYGFGVSASTLEYQTNTFHKFYVGGAESVVISATDLTIGGVSAVTVSGTQTLTNKTLIGAKFNHIYDENGVTIIALQEIADAVNYIRVQNGAAGSNVSLYSDGADDNINLNLSAKGTGVVRAKGIEVATISGTQTLTNKTITSPVLSGTITGTYTFGGTPTFPSTVVTTTGTQTLTNKTISLSQLTDLYTSTPTNVNYELAGNAGNYPAFSPVPKYLWHDLLRFSRWFGEPTYETYSGSWSSQTLNNAFFNGKEAQAVTVADGTTTTAVRWTWNSGNVSWSNISWWVIGFTYVAGGQANDILVESSSNGSDWTVRHTSTSYASARPVWLYQSDHDGDAYLRLTITAIDSKSIVISSIRALSTRWGNQGGGSEYEQPYAWDNDQNITIGDNTPRSSGALNLGSTSTTTASGGVYFGNDTNLYRSAANTLRTDDNLIVGTAGTSAGSVATIDGTQTLTNKTISLANNTLSTTLAQLNSAISDTTLIAPTKLFNNMGGTHSTNTAFDAQGGASTVDFGWRYIKGYTNGPGVNGAAQYYSLFAGLGSEYNYNQYGMQIAFPRNVSNPYISIRYQENGSFAAWQKISAGYADTSGSATTATTATNQSGGTVSATTGVFSTYASTDEIRNRTGAQLVLSAGESYSNATGQTSEYIYLNAENGLEINSSSDNWATGWAGRNTATINDSSGSSTFPGSVSVGTSQSTSNYIEFQKTATAAQSNLARIRSDSIIVPGTGNDLVLSGRSTSGGIVFETGNTGVRQLALNASGELLFGTSGDTNLYRSAANTLKTDDTLIIGSAGTAAGSAVTIDGTQTLTNKTLASPTISGTLAGSFTWTGDISTEGGTNRIRFGNTNELTSNDGSIAAGRFGAGLNIVGTKTEPSGDRHIRTWGSIIDNATGSEYITAASVNTLTNKTLSSPVLSGTITGTYTFGGTPTFPSTIVTTSDLLTTSAALRANRNLNGGGTITVDGSGYVKWSQRFIVIANGRGSYFSTAGFFDINCPTSGTITGVGGASDKTATSAGIPLNTWEALYYIMPIGSGNSSISANFRVVRYTSDVDIPHDWLLICIRNGDSASGYPITFNNGITLTTGQSMHASHQDNANTANTLVRRDGSGNFSAGTITASLSGNATTATTATNQSGGTVNATTGVFSTYVSTDEIRPRSNQQLVLNAGESFNHSTGQTSEYVYINAESGLEINSSPDNWASGWAGRVTTVINDDGITWNGNEVWHAGNDDSLARKVQSGTATTQGGLKLFGIPGVSFYGGGTWGYVAGNVVYYPFYITYPVTLTDWLVDVTTGPASTANMRVGLYQADEDMQPTGSILFDSGNTSVASGYTGTKTGSMSVALQPGAYLIAVNFSVNMTLRIVGTTSNWINPSLGANPICTSFFAAQTYGAFPSTGTPWTGASTWTIGGHAVFFKWTE